MYMCVHVYVCVGTALQAYTHAYIYKYICKCFGIYNKSYISI